jgi:hypothetical protein
VRRWNSCNVDNGCTDSKRFDEQYAMGLFLSASGVVSPNGNAVRDAIASYVASTGGSFESRAGTTNDRNIGVMQSIESTTTVLYPDGFSDWDDLSRFLSLEVKRPVFSFHIHDGDLWMFVAFHDGKEVAWFNPIPDYWARVNDAERERWAGNAEVVASLVPGLAASSIERYFVPWSEDVLAAEEKSYDDDEFAIGVDWQLTDFMRRLGFTYPLDHSGAPTGETFYLKIRRPRTTSAATVTPTPLPESPSPQQKRSVKPWWRFW